MMKNIWEKWKSFAESLGNLQFNILFSILYYILIVPVGLTSNFFGDFLKIKGFPRWEKVGRGYSNIKELKEQ